MSKRPVVINYADHRKVLDTIADYYPVEKRGANESDKFGIAYVARSGEITEAMGTDKVSRDKALGFLDSYFKPEFFPSEKCEVCVYREEENCERDHECRYYNNYNGFKREEKHELDKLCI